MLRPPKPPTLLQRQKRLVLLVLAAATVVLAAFGVWPAVAVLIFAVVGFATFVDGPPRAGDGTYESGVGLHGTRGPL